LLTHGGMSRTMLCNAALMVRLSNFYSSFKPNFSRIFCSSFKLFENQTVRILRVHCISTEVSYQVHLYSWRFYHACLKKKLYNETFVLLTNCVLSLFVSCPTFWDHVVASRSQVRWPVRWPRGSEMLGNKHPATEHNILQKRISQLPCSENFGTHTGFRILMPTSWTGKEWTYKMDWS
jgi:hypothetical protein